MNNYNDEPVEISDLEEQYNAGYDDGYQDGLNDADKNILESINNKLGCIVFILAVPFIIAAFSIIIAIGTGISVFEMLF